MTTKLLDKKEVAAGTMMFSFQKPAGFHYKAGQNIDLTLINPPETDGEGNMRTFSITASPSEL
jgi:ferredoxin-NADP reductase